MFRLHKWYFDCVAPDGDAAIVYAARLHWGLLRLGYTALLDHHGGRTHTRTLLGRPPAPTLGSDGCELVEPRLGLHAKWRGRPQLADRELWRSPRGAVVWSLRLPDATAELTFAGRTLRGRGYVEHLALDVAPWHLPIDELRWGRWHGANRSLVWIEWRGPHPLRLCLLDGEPVDCGPITDCGFTFADGRRLALGTPTVLRDGDIERTVLTRRLLRWLPLPRAIRAMRETKWLSSGVLHGAGNDAIEGTALHEVVRWG